MKTKLIVLALLLLLFVMSEPVGSHHSSVNQAVSVSCAALSRS